MKSQICGQHLRVALHSTTTTREIRGSKFITGLGVFWLKHCIGIATNKLLVSSIPLSYKLINSGNHVREALILTQTMSSA